MAARRRGYIPLLSFEPVAPLRFSLGVDPAPHILVVDDHRDIRDLLARYLVKHGLRASVAESAAEARKAMRAAQFDLVVLDIMMPGEDGLSLTRSLRETIDVPVILLTAMGEETDRIVGLEVGADDYLVKPFNPRELLARIKAVLRRVQTVPRSRESSAGRLRFDRWMVDLGRRELVDDKGVGLPLSSGEFRLLVALLERPGMVLTRDQLLDLTRGRSAQPFDRSIDNQISRLRRKLERDPRNPELIRTAWGDGYSFTAEVIRL
jgi:two-component system OmpR family response regulator